MYREGKTEREGGKERERAGERETEREIFYPLVHPLSGLNGQG